MPLPRTEIRGGGWERDGDRRCGVGSSAPRSSVGEPVVGSRAGEAGRRARRRATGGDGTRVHVQMYFITRIVDYSVLDLPVASSRVLVVPGRYSNSTRVHVILFGILQLYRDRTNY